jgi:endonuclease/exonuclease/phosphatase (EEP) superfamily protein YafD
MRSRLVTVVGLLQAAAILTIAFSIITLLPADHFALQLFSHFRLQYFVVSLLLMLVFAGLRSYVYAGALLLVCLVNASQVLPWYFDAKNSETGADLTVMLANVLSSNTEYERLFDLLEAEEPDIVVLLEVSPDWLVELAALRTEYPYSYAEARDGNYGIALFSRLPISSADHVDSPPFGFPTINASLTAGNQLLHLVATHPMIPVSGQTYIARNEQLESLPDLLRRPAGATILIGDLNTGMWEPNYRTLVQETGLKNARRGFGVLPTWPTFLPFAMIPIDHVLVSQEIGVKGMRTGRHIGSDHLPLIVELAL